MTPDKLLIAIFATPFAGLALGLVAFNWRAMTAGRPPPKPLHDMELDELRALRARLSDPARMARSRDPDGLARRLERIDQHVAHRLRVRARDAASAGAPRAAALLSPSEMGGVFPSSAWFPASAWAGRANGVPGDGANANP